MRKRAASNFLAILFLVSLHVPATAQLIPKPYFSGAIRGQVVDAASGQPLEGAVVVARWDWLDYRSAFEGSGFYANGDVVHMGEAVADRGGRFTIPGWGPKTRAGGKMDEKAPNLIAFKAGYEPLQRAIAGDAPIRLRKFAGSSKQYAESIARLQGAIAPGGGDVGLGWQHGSDNWKAMPRMILALHREKARLGEDGAAIRGANLLHGRAGKGGLVDAESKQPVSPAVVRIAWTMRRSDGTPGTRRMVQAKRAGIEGSGSSFFVSPWRLPGPELPGWEIDPDAVPLVRVYAPGYRRSAEVRWEEKGAIVSVQKLPASRDAVLAELRAWRGDLDAELARNQSEADLAAQRPLLAQLAEECKGITPDLRVGICFPADSPVARYLDKTRGLASFPMETEEGVRTIRVVAVDGGSRLQAQSVAMPAGPAGQPARVGGFTIEPVR